MEKRLFGLVFVFTLADFRVPAASYQAQVPCAAGQKIMLNAALILTPEFCGTKLKKGLLGFNHETFEIGKAVCAELETGLTGVFKTLTRQEQISSATGAEVFLVPKFLDNEATQTMFAFAKRELTINVEWTAKDDSGKVIWVEAVQGSAKRAPGNAFNHGIQLKRIVRDSVKDLAGQSASRMLHSQALRKLDATNCN